nr:hypothetical protein [Palleronia sediminis]
MVVLAGAPLAGLAQVVRDRLPVPVIDCQQAAVKRLEGLIPLGATPVTAGSFRRPAAKLSTGLSVGPDPPAMRAGGLTT